MEDKINIIGKKKQINANSKIYYILKQERNFNDIR